MAQIAPLAAPRQCEIALHESDCPRRPGGEAVHCGDSALDGGDRLLLRTPRPPSWLVFGLREFRCPPPSGGVAAHRTSFTAH